VTSLSNYIVLYSADVVVLQSVVVVNHCVVVYWITCVQLLLLCLMLESGV